MALIVEDGSIIASANSYITDAVFTAYADSRGFTYPATVELREVLIIKAMDYLESKKYKGLYVSPDVQSLAFPRYSVYSRGRTINSDEIPQELINAQCELAIAANTLELQVNEASKDVQSQGLGSLSVSYFKGGANQTVRLDRAMGWLSDLLEPTNKLVRA